MARRKVEALGKVDGRYQVVVRDGVGYGIVLYRDGSAGLAPWVSLCDEDPSLLGAEIEVDNAQVLAAVFG